MRTLCNLVTGDAADVVIATSDPAEAAQRRDDVNNFCRAAPDLCVFVCSGDWDCPSLSGGYICESRHGTLVVEENGERSCYETNYSLCWHRTRSPDDPLPDPEEDHVPTMP